MASRSALRKSLRRIPALRSLPAGRLEEIIDRMSLKEYKRGEVLWRTSAPTDFLGIIEDGQVTVERRMNGSIVGSARLSAGDCVLPHPPRAGHTHSVVLARAATDVKLHVLPGQQIEAVRSMRPNAPVSRPRAIRPDRHPFQGVIWTAILAAMIIVLTWRDLARAASDMLYLSAAGAIPAIGNGGSPRRLLRIAELVDPRAAFAQNQEGTLSLQKSDVRGAQAAFAEAVQIDPANGPALNNLAVTYFVTGLDGPAIRVQEEAVQNDPDNAVVRYNLGLALLRQGSLQQALLQFRQSSYIDPAWALPRIQMACLYLQMQDAANAERAAGEAVRLDPSQQAAHLALAIALYNQGKDQQALASVQAALRIDPDQAIAMFYKARILSGLGKYEEALTTYDELLRSAGAPQLVARIGAEIEALRRLQHHALPDSQ